MTGRSLTESTSQDGPQATADFALRGGVVVTQDETRRVFQSGAVAVKGDRIVWVGPDRDLDTYVAPRRDVDCRDCVLTPGFINAHVHITGDPLTRHYTPDNANDDDRLFTWTIPRYYAHTPEDEGLSAKFCGLELLKSGTTTFLEAGTIRHLDNAVDGLRQAGVRSLVGAWVDGRAFDPSEDQTKLIDTAIRTLEDQNTRYPPNTGDLIAAWPILVGHNMNTDEIWRVAKRIADAENIGVAAHMSPYQADPDWFLEHVGRRPIEHLADIGVLGPNTTITHATHLDDSEIDLMAQTGANVAYCPFASLKGGFGVAHAGKYPEMRAKGVDILFATDGYDCEMLPNARLGASIFKDLKEDVAALSALETLDMITCSGARTLGLDAEIGSLEAGKKADILSFDTSHMQWRPLLSVIDQLIWSADARSLCDVWVDGVNVVTAGRSSLIDEDELLNDVQASADAILKRADLPDADRGWTMV